MDKTVVVTVPLELCGIFNSGSPITVALPTEHGLVPGDVVLWDCGGEHSGRARVLHSSPSDEVDKANYTIEKL